MADPNNYIKGIGQPFALNPGPSTLGMQRMVEEDAARLQKLKENHSYEDPMVTLTRGRAMERNAKLFSESVSLKIRLGEEAKKKDVTDFFSLYNQEQRYENEHREKPHLVGNHGIKVEAPWGLDEMAHELAKVYSRNLRYPEYHRCNKPNKEVIDIFTGEYRSMTFLELFCDHNPLSDKRIKDGRIELIYWRPSQLMNPPEELIANPKVRKYLSESRSRGLSRLRPRAPDVAATINIFVKANKSNKLEFEGRVNIINKGLISDTISGQTFPRETNEFEVTYVSKVKPTTYVPLDLKETLRQLHCLSLTRTIPLSVLATIYGEDFNGFGFFQNKPGNTETRLRKFRESFDKEPLFPIKVIR